jgi:methylmalonyl-CoA mutase cobalamin-binding subunit
MGMEASEHRVDLAVVSRMESGTDGVRAIAAIRDALRAAGLEIVGWRSVLLGPAFADTLSRGRGSGVRSCG